MELPQELAGALGAMNRRNATRMKPDDVRAAVVALRSSQFLFESQAPGHYAVLRSMRLALEPHFELSGMALRIDDGEGVASLIPAEGVPRLAMSVDETLFLLTLRWIYESKVELREVEVDGTVRADEAEIQQWFEQKSGRPWPKRSVWRAAVDLMERRNLVVASQDDAGHTVLFVRSVVRDVTGSGWLGRMQAFLDATEGRAVQREQAAAEAEAEGSDEGAPAPTMAHDGDVE